MTASASPRRAAAAPRFHALTVRDVRRETADAVSIAFDIPETLAEAFRFAPGQYLTLRTRLAGEELRRSYSICSGLDDGEIRVAVKRVEGGRFSSFANEAIAVGASIEAMAPDGRFGLPIEPHAARSYLAIAAGSGITPILSIVKSVLAREHGSRVFLIYGNRTSASILFRDELEDLKDRFVGRLSVHHVLSRERHEAPLMHGRLDAERVRRLAGAICAPQRIDHAFLCGPAEMMSAAETALVGLGLPAERIRMERFGDATTASAPKPAPTPPAAEGGGVRLSVAVDGLSHDLRMQPGETIMEAAERHGLELPYSCRAGMCCTCRARIVEGAAEMAVNYSLEPWEREAGYVLACQARPTTATLAVDFDET